MKRWKKRYNLFKVRFLFLSEVCILEIHFETI
jgi:hypothetical protein